MTMRKTEISQGEDQIRSGRVRLALSLVLSVLAGLPTLAQAPAAQVPPPPPPVRNSVAQLQSTTPKYATNLAPPTMADDTFLGQDKPGPYILTWRSFQSGLGNPVQIFVDGKLLGAGAYTLDVIKGELVFQLPIKRTQLIRARYGYYLGIAQKNPNATPAAPLTVSLAALGISSLSMTAMPGADNTSARVVWNLSSKTALLGGGFTSQLNFAPDAGQGATANAGGAAADRVGVKLGYATGNTKNGMDVSFLRGGKQFAPSVGKNFGYADATQNLGLAGRMTPTQWLGFNVGRTEIRDLTGKGATEAQTLGLRLGGTKGSPLTNFARTTTDQRDAKGLLTATVTEGGDFAGKLGAANLVAKRNETTTTTPDQKQAGALQENIAFNLNAKGAPTVGLNRTEDSKTDVTGFKTGSQVEQGNLVGKVGGLNINAKTNKSRVATNEKNVKQVTQVNQEAYTLAYVPKNQPALNVARNNNFTVNPAGVRVGTGTDLAELTNKWRTGKFGVADLVARTQKVLTATPDKKQVEIETKTLGLNYAGTKPGTPGVILTRVGEERTDASGVTKTDSNIVGFKDQLGPLSVDAKSTSADVLTPDKKNIDVEQRSYTLGYGDGKKQPKFGFFRSEDERKPEEKDWFGAVASRYDVAHRVGTADLSYQLQQNNLVTADQKESEADLATFQVRLANGPKRPGLTFSRTEDDKTDPSARKTEVVTNKTELTSKFGTADATVRTTQAETNTPDPKTTGASQDTALLLAAAGGTKGTGASITLSTGQSETGAATEQRQGVGVKLQPSPKVILSAEQKDQLITPFMPSGSAGTTKNITSLTTGAELMPMPGTKLTGAWQSTEDGTTRIGVTQYGAALGTDKSAFQFSGNLKDRFSLGATTPNPAANLDTANARLALRPFSGFQVTGAYTLNPEDPAKQNQVSPLTRHEYGLAANLGAIQLGGTYAMNEYAIKHAEAVKAGAPSFGEYLLTLGMRFNRYTNLNSTYKNTFFYGAGPKGLQIYTFGLTHNVGSAMNFTMGGTMTSNLAVASGPLRTDYKAEAKLGVKF